MNVEDIDGFDALIVFEDESSDNLLVTSTSRYAPTAAFTSRSGNAVFALALKFFGVVF